MKLSGLERSDLKKVEKTAKSELLRIKRKRDKLSISMDMTGHPYNHIITPSSNSTANIIQPI